MKYLGSRTVGVASIILLLASTGKVVLAQISPMNPISIQVNADDHKTSSNSTKHVRIETRTEKLEITLQNTTQQNYSDLTLRYCIFAKDVNKPKKDGQPQPIDTVLRHATPIVIPKLATLTITSEVASITDTPNQDVPANQKSTRRGERERLVKASGKEYAGYGVEVLQSNLIIGQLFSSLDLTDQFTAAFSHARKKP